MTSPLDSGAACPCGSGRPLGACCGPLLAGVREAQTARELMRSRYTAHALGDEAYLHRTYAPTAGRPFKPTRTASPKVQWVGLTIHADEVAAADLGYVEFSARWRDRNGEHVMRERSEFRRVGERWFYTRAV